MNNFEGSFYFEKPFPASNQDIIVSLNGYIDNREELDKIFKSQNFPASTNDQEAVLTAFKIWGASFASHLQGDFAIAVWDGKNNQLLLTRDPLGVKPLFYYQDSEKTIFSSSIKQIFKESSLSKKPNTAMLSQFFMGEFLDYESTFFQGIKQVPPAHTITFQVNGESHLTRFWAPNTNKIEIYPNKQQYLDEFYRLFERSVRNRIKGNSPAGLLFSGGLDSTQIGSMAHTLRQKDTRLPALNSVCIIPEGFLEEDKASLDAFMKRFDPSLDVIDYYSEHQNIFEVYLEPTDTPHYDAFLTVPLLLKRLADKGCQTVLTGYGANEYSNLMEFGYLEDLLLGFKLKKFSSECERLAECMNISGNSVKTMLFMETLREKTPYWIRKLIRQNRINHRLWLRPEFRKQMAPLPPTRLRPFKKLSQNETFHTLFEPIIPINLTQMAEGAQTQGMGIRHPFLDLPLIEFFLSIPVEIKMEGGYRKNFIQQALASIMPIPTRIKDDERAYIPFKDRAARIKLELPVIAQYLSNSKRLIYDYVDYEVLKKQLLNPQLRFHNYPLLWRLVRLANWLELHWGNRFS